MKVNLHLELLDENDNVIATEDVPGVRSNWKATIQSEISEIEEKNTLEWKKVRITAEKV